MDAYIINQIQLFTNSPFETIVVFWNYCIYFLVTDPTIHFQYPSLATHGSDKLWLVFHIISSRCLFVPEYNIREIRRCMQKRRHDFWWVRFSQYTQEFVLYKSEHRIALCPAGQPPVCYYITWLHYKRLTVTVIMFRWVINIFFYSFSLNYWNKVFGFEHNMQRYNAMYSASFYGWTNCCVFSMKGVCGFSIFW